MTEDVRSRVAALPADRRAALEAVLAARRARADRIGKRDPALPAVLGPSQRRLWFLHQLAPHSPVYNAVVAIRAVGPLDTAVLAQALLAVIERHDILRTVIGGSVDEPEQIVVDADRLMVETVDVSPAGPEADETALALAREFCRRPYDLTADLPVRLLAVRLGDDAHLLVFAEHHIAFDGWSDIVMFAELSAAYRAASAGTEWDPEPLDVQFADVARWWAGRPPAERTEQYWADHLAGAPVRVDLPVDHPRPPVPSYRGRHVPIVLDGLGDPLAAMQSAESATAFMTLTAAFASSVMRWSGTSDLVMGTPFANRDRAEFEPLIGFFSNTLPLRVRAERRDTFRDLVRRMRGVCVGAFQHQDLAFDRIVELARQPRDPSRNPLFQVNVRVQQGEPALPDLPGVHCTPVAVDLGFSRFDLAVDFTVAGDVIAGYVEYDEALFGASTIEQFIAWTSEHVAACLRSPDVPLAELPFGPQRSAVRGRRRAPQVT